MALKMRKNRAEDIEPLCPLGECMQLIGGLWTPNIIWHLSGGARRFSELKRDIGKISAKMLTTRLREMEMAGVVERSVVPTSPPSVEYQLTDLGEELMPAIKSIVSVGKRLKIRNGVAWDY
ncbi:transcriptional regulator [Sphingorhabdus sp. IMCC26285]|uniref:Transcriptional regulator n=2 Tax=Sphingorhabdus profundilacus TaxID=2509718 RepID=A0A6I4M1G8_9SPHN|nr:transcriptional regulator [Sphingorhabdus profundilacus]